jgi:hypothetical protein
VIEAAGGGVGDGDSGRVQPQQQQQQQHHPAVFPGTTVGGTVPVRLFMPAHMRHLLPGTGTADDSNSLYNLIVEGVWGRMFGWIDIQ